MHALLDAPSPNTRYGIRDRAMLYVAYSVGLRVSELVGLRLENLNFSPHSAFTFLAKVGANATCPCGEKQPPHRVPG